MDSSSHTVQMEELKPERLSTCSQFYTHPLLRLFLFPPLPAQLPPVRTPPHVTRRYSQKDLPKTPF